MKALIILNDPPYGTERSYNGLRLAMSLAKTEGTELRLFLMADAVACAKADQKTPDGYYNLERMLRGLASKQVPVGACGTCLDARGLIDADLVAGAHRSSMAELADWTLWADKVVTF
ncbi:MAG TPA: DsrE family protein [Candidatus Dormibacteraeota bacterium]|nr:DsrE family protein [Candidatus Dormibacteraeota bacterium]